MFDKEEKYNLKENTKKRKIFTIIGASILIIGVILTIIGVVTFFSGDPSLFYLFFIAFPLMFIGSSLIKIFNVGRLNRFISKQVAPVKKDVANYMIEGTSENITKVVKDIKGKQSGRACLKCGNINPKKNKFCGDCGEQLF